MRSAPATRFSLLTKLVCVLVSALALFLVFRRVDVPTLGRTLAGSKPAWILAALAVFGLAFVAAAARWHVVLGLTNCRVHALATFRTVLIGHLFNTLFFGPTGGDVAKSALYARWYRFEMPAIVSTCVLDRALGGFGFFVFAVCTPGVAVYGGHWRDRMLHSFQSPRFWAAVAIGIGALVALKFFRERIRQLHPVRRLVQSLFSQSAELFKKPRLAARGLGFAILSHLCISCVFLFSLESVSQARFSWAAVFWIFPVISVITAAPVTFSGAGLREGAALFFLGLYGIPASDAVAASLLVLFTYLIWGGLAGLLLWKASRQRAHPAFTAVPETLSIVIPTLNEALALPETLARARRVPEACELIVVDAGSTDDTLAVAQRFGCRTFKASGGRGAQLRLGALEATGDVVLMLHADTWLPAEAGRAVLDCFRDCTVAAGGFWKVFREKHALMAGSRFRCAVRLLLFQRILGDQVLFVRRTALEAIGGVPAVPLMEEFELCRRFRRQGNLALASATVSTSARRFKKRGILRTYLRMAHVTMRYYLGTPLEELKELYERD